MRFRTRRPSASRRPAGKKTFVANAQNTVTGGGATSAAGQAINSRTGSNVGVTAGHGNGTSVMRLKEGVERFMITDTNNPAAGAKAKSDIFIMYDRLSTIAAKFNHVPGGSNILFMDGHVEFMRFPGKPPVQPGFAAFDRLVNEGN